MKIQIFSQYYNLSQAGWVKPLACPMHKEETAIFPLVHQEVNEKISLYCLACGYKNYPGQQFYDNLISLIASAKNEPKKMENE